MSEREPPPPPGRDNRTVVRPNPGGRRPALAPDGHADRIRQAPPAPDWSQTGARPAFAPPPHGAPPYGTPPPYPNVLPSGAAPPSAGRDEEWIKSSAPAAIVPVAPRRPPSSIDELFAPNGNPFMRAAAPVLLLLGRLRASLVAASFVVLIDQVGQAIHKFDAEVRRCGVPEDQANRAKYILCSTADDIIQNIPTEDRHQYARYSMLASFFGERVGGVRFFEITERDQRDPVVNYPILELEHACLALGFQGRYRSEGGGMATLQGVQRSIYETLRRVRPRVARDLSPNWKGQALAARAARSRVPVWAVSGIALLLVFGLYLVLRYLLSGGAEIAAAATLDLNGSGPLTIARRTFAPPPPAPAPTPAQLTQLQRIRQALAPEISAGTISVPDPTGPKWIVINVGSTLLFDSGEATIAGRFKPLAERIRAMLERETGTIDVVGHTDNTPLTPTSPFRSNFDLSVARAKNAVAVLSSGFSRPDRFRTEGKGPDEPVAENKTEAGRRQNRRVEILVQRTE